jgi:AcrR family transcriptional regulator
MIRPAKQEKKNGSVGSVEERREKIAEAASMVIANKGFAASSIREIADAAGMHVPTMYQYVSSKDEVLELVYRWVMRRVRENVDKALVSTQDPRERLRAVTLKLIENNTQGRRDTGVLNRELRSLSKTARARVLDEYVEVVGDISEVISEGVASGEFRPVNPVIIANFIDALCDMWALRQFAIGQYSVEEYREQLLEFIERGLFAGDQDSMSSGN